MFIDRNILEEYPFDGGFYTYEIDYSKPLDEQKEEEVLVLETKCDIQESGKALSNTVTATYAIYFPFDKETGVNITNGMEFRGDLYGLRVNGIVKGVFPTQMGGCVAYVVDKDI